MSYDGEHVQFDDFEVPVSIQCIKCDKVIGRRQEIPSAAYAGMTQQSMIKTGEYTEVYCELSNGSQLYVPMCKGCAKDPIDRDKAMDVIKRTWELELIKRNRPSQVLEQQRERVKDLRIVKSEVSNNAG